ncbi:MAG: ribosome biogenesis GTPase Der, partial [Gammaproteobacteria bacterium]
GTPYAISSAHGRGVEHLINTVLDALPERTEQTVPATTGGIHVAVIGRPNVGKSTLINRMLGEDRLVAFDRPGTTRDTVFVPFERDGHSYVMIDTAGVRRRSRVHEAVEKFSVVKTLQAIDRADVVIGVLDAHEGVSEQDAGLLGLAMERGRAVVIAVNKWDGLAPDARDRVRALLEIKLPFLSFAPVHFISALHGSGVGDLFGSIREAWRAACAELSTSELTRVLQEAVSQHQPPLVRGRRIKLRYAHQGGKRPPVIVIHGNQTESVPEDYRRYLVNTFRRAFGLEGTPVRVEFRSGSNPFAGRRNKLTPRQLHKKKRLERFVKRRK